MTTYEVIKIFVCHTKDLFQLQTTDVSFKKEKRSRNYSIKKKRKRDQHIFFSETHSLRGELTQNLSGPPSPGEYFSKCFWLEPAHRLEWTYIMLGLCCWWLSHPQEGSGQKVAVGLGDPVLFPKGKTCSILSGRQKSGAPASPPFGGHQSLPGQTVNSHPC